MLMDNNIRLVRKRKEGEKSRRGEKASTTLNRNSLRHNKFNASFSHGNGHKTRTETSRSNHLSLTFTLSLSLSSLSSSTLAPKVIIWQQSNLIVEVFVENRRISTGFMSLSIPPSSSTAVITIAPDGSYRPLLYIIESCDSISIIHTLSTGFFCVLTDLTRFRSTTLSTRYHLKCRFKCTRCLVQTI